MIGLLFLIAAVINVVLFVQTHDFDKAVIAVLFVVAFFNQKTINIWRTRATTGRGVQ